MSATDYHSWSKFDEDAALQQSEEEEMHAEALRAQKRAELAKAELEAKVLRDSGQAAAALKSKSDVETLKAKQAGKRRGRGSPADAAANAAEAEKLRLLAEATARINECMQRGITLRSEAAKLTRAKRWSEAFDAALAALALLSEARGRIGADSGHATPFAQESHMCNGAGGSCSHHGDRESGNGHAHNGPCGGSHGHSHDHSHVESCHGPECGHGGTGASASSTSSSPPPAAAAAAASDVRNVLRVAHGDCGVIMGVCAASEGRLGEAADLLRAVLLEQPRRVDAWVARGEVFARMGVPLLADLHAQQAASLDDARPADAALTWLLSPGEAMEKLPRPPSALPPVPLLLPSSGVIAGADGGGGSSGDDGVQEGAALSGHVGENVDGAASAPAASSATLQAAREAAEFYRQGVALHREQCFLSARAKFEAALCLAEEASATSGADGAAAAPATIGGAAAPADDGLATDAATTSAAAAADPAADPAAAAAGAATAAAAATDPAGDAAAAAPAAGTADQLPALLRALRLACYLNMAAGALLRQRELGRAIEHCTRALAIDPACLQARLRRARAHEDAGNFRLAMEDLAAAEADLLGRCDKEGANELAVGAGLTTEDMLAHVHAQMEQVAFLRRHVGGGKEALPAS